MGGVYEILNWMTGDNLFTHQLPRAMDECKPSLDAQHPGLAAVELPEDLGSREIIDAWLETLYPEFGEYVEVAPVPRSDHTVIDPISELKMMRPDMPIIAVEL
jgi:hypothetical protein